MFNVVLSFTTVEDAQDCADELTGMGYDVIVTHADSDEEVEAD